MTQRRRTTRMSGKSDDTPPTKPPRASADTGSAAAKGHPQDVKYALLLFLEALTELVQTTNEALRERE